MSFTLGEYQDIFLEEADEQLQELNQNLLELEKNPEDIDIINDIFRAAHSLKSSAAFVGLNDLSSLAHKMENLLQGIRDRTLKVTPEIVDIIFKCFDEINSVIDSIAAGEKPAQDLTWIIEEIQSVSENAYAGASKDSAKKPDDTAVKDVADTIFSETEEKEILNALGKGQKCYELTVTIEESTQMKWVKAQLIIGNLSRLGTVVKSVPPSEELTSDEMADIFKVVVCTDAGPESIKNASNIDLIKRVELKEINKSQDDEKSITLSSGNVLYSADEDPEHTTVNVSEESLNEEHSGSEGEMSEDYDDSEDSHEFRRDKRVSERIEQERKKTVVSKTVKVSIDKLDQLLNNVGELVIANSGFYKLYDEIRQLTGDKAIVNEFKNRMEGMSRIAKDLQAGIMKTRMVEIGQIFSRFNRLVRDLTKEFKKKVDLVIKGEDTELDKKVIDAIGEPLLHLIRNAIDHGIEVPEERKRLGKPETARITLNAYQGGNHIFVEVSDDGKGLNSEVILRKAIEKGLVSAESASTLDNAEIYNFIFAPGFSTAKKITDVSGRGVGMNVVKQIVTDLNGSVSIETEPGMGTRFVLTFPLTLAIIPAIMVKVRTELYAIPLSDVVETIKISQSDITTIEGHEVINLRGEILSLLRLNQFIRTESDLGREDKIPVVVVGFGNRKIGLIVDYLEGKMEIVIKSLEQNYRTVEGLAGASILGDGSICLILDIATMINKVITDQEKLTVYERRGIIDTNSAEVETLKYEDASGEDKRTIKAESEREDKEEEEKDARSGAEETDTFEAPPEDISVMETGTMQSDEKEEDVSLNVIVEDKSESSDSFDIPEVIDKEEEIIIDVDGSDEGDIADISEELPQSSDEKSETGETVDIQVKEALEDFRSELKNNVGTALESGDMGDHMERSLNIDRDDIREFQLVANVGATNAAESLSRILNKRIDLTIPEVVIKPTESIPEFIGNIDSAYIGVMMPVKGDIDGTVLFIFDENIGFELIDLLYGTDNKSRKELDEDGESALNELTNIIGSSVINVIAEKTNLMIKPDVPTIVHDYMQSIIDSILIMHGMKSDYAIVMDTAFYFENDRLIGNFLFFPEAEALKIIVEGLRSNVGSN